MTQDLVEKTTADKTREEKPSKEPAIRSIARALHVMQAINRHGALSMTQISKAVGIPYPTACRVVYTLVKEGVIEREASRKYYRPTALSQSLSCGYQESARLVAIARPHIVELTKEIWWPVSIATRVGPMMVIQYSTHAMTTLTYSDYNPGYSLPIVSSASGMAYLAFSGDKERENIIEQLKRSSIDEEETRLLNNLRNLHFDMILKDGYASFIKNPGKTSSIAVPLYEYGQIAATMALAFFSSALRVEDAFEKHKKLILDTQQKINEDLMNPDLFPPPTA